MANIAAGDLTYTMISRQVADSGHKKYVFTIAFGDSSLTYPSGGIPLTKAKLGCPNTITSLNIFSPASDDGNIYKYDAANEKIRCYRTPGHAHDLLIKGGQAAASTAATAYYATNIFGKEAATDQTIAKADSATKGGVIAEAAVAMAEFVATTTAPAATTLYVEVTGW